jgi:hypothetical protein
MTDTILCKHTKLIRVYAAPIKIKHCIVNGELYKGVTLARVVTRDDFGGIPHFRETLVADVRQQVAISKAKLLNKQVVRDVD